ncbi:MAG TPA: hypothetical protein VGJ78_07480 [Vicinamibacterales bacterium]
MSIALAAVLLLAPAAASAQDSKSAASVIEFVKMLDSMKLDSYAVKGASANEYVGVLYFPGTQLLVVSAKFDTPYRADSLIQMKDYRDLYIELNSASMPNTKVFVSDLSANGLKAKKDGNLYDTADIGGKTFNFDGDWKKAKITEDDYTKAYSTTDEQYSQMIQALLAGLKKSS